MKKWMRVMSLMFALLVMFCLMGSVGVKASSSSEEVIYRVIRVEYTGDPVHYKEAIQPSDISVYVETNLGRRYYLSTNEFSISPDTMQSKRDQRVYVYINGTNYRPLNVTVKYAEPRLESIEARYRGSDLIVNGEINKDDVTVEAFYDDGTSEYVDDWSFGSYRLREGSNTIEIVYREDGERAYDEITVYAYAGELDYISAYYNGNSVVVGNRVDTSKIKVTGVYSSRGYSSVTQTLTGWSLSDNRAVQEGNNTFTVVYRENGKEYTDTITVRGVVSTTVNPNANPNPNTSTNNVTTTSSRSGAWVQSGAVWKFQLSNKTYLKNSWVQSAETAKWYFVDADGNMAANKWAQINGKWYYLNPDGTMATGWKMVDGKWYYLNAPNGDMQTGWKLHSDNKYYYLTPGSGEMAVSRWIDNYYVDENGVWTQTR